MNDRTSSSALAIEDRMLPIAGIRHSQQNLRRAMDPGKFHQLVQSMDGIGQLQNIGVYPIACDQYELLFGQRRLSAAALLGWKTIRASIFPINGRHQNVILAIQSAENLQIERLKTVEIIEVIRQFKDFGLARPAIAKVLSQSPDWVSDHEFVLQDAMARSIAEAAMLLDAASLRTFMEFTPSIRNILLETA